ncbi:alpha/beta hydrolase [Methylobacterium nonmethylotrophicum]|uniref:Alpha/beta fold hydrolase n=1 Tax=Methylobacterium nonmethylotrophicum TaxID=1141884 RepID=A0A4Z0NVX5_9HYPH|nr:alpha/beta fold hydrolase [Methylobacterium nonmethylotrophicum]TGE01307.1 alpha/beta fold hydrolase [Methylobacterium nonmethylotrophicum]
MTLRAAPTRRGLARLGFSALASLSLGGCLGEGLLGEPLPERQSALDVSPVLLVATTRRPADPAGRPPYFTDQRGRGLAFASVRLSAPDRSLIGKVSSVVTGDWRIAASPRVVTGPEAATAFAEAALGRDVLIYVHGYRESFETAAVSAAQLSDGIRFRGVSGLFSWPSAGKTFDYGYDRESALWSRDAFEDLLRALATAQGGRIHIVAHSMGTLLTLETLRMLRADAGEAALDRIGAVVLAAPDIDIDLFTNGIERLGTAAQKITVISSTNDRALELSSTIAGGVIRAGAADRSRLEALGVRVADASDYGSGLINHDLFLSNVEVQQVIKRAVARADGR